MGQIKATLIAAALTLCSSFVMAMPLPKKSITLESAELAKLQATIPLPHPDTAVTITDVYVLDLGGSMGEPRATFETDAYETGHGYRRHRLGWCERFQGEWRCTPHDRLTRVIDDVTTTSVLPTDMATELAIRALEFAIPLINAGVQSEREFSIHFNDDLIFIIYGSGCSSTMKIRRKGENFEKLPLDSNRACN